jgi:hypothetical protein
MWSGLDGIIGSLHDALKRAQLDEGGHDAALEAASSLARPPHLAELLRLLRDDVEAVAACASQSYLHPLGFFKIMLVNASPLFELRLHVWWPGSSPGVDHVHNHRFAFTSTAVRGGYTMQVFQTDPAGSPVHEYREMVRPQGGWQLTPVGSAGLRLLTSVKLEPGASYALTAQALHRVAVIPGTLCITLLLRTALAPGSTTRVFAKPGHGVPAMIPVTRMSGDDYRQQLEALLSELTGLA